MQIADAGLIQTCRERFLGKAGAARIGDFAHIHECFDLGLLERRDEVRHADAFITDGPDRFQSHCKVTAINTMRPIKIRYQANGAKPVRVT